MDSTIDDRPARVNPAWSGPMNPLDLKACSRTSLTVLVSAPRDSALRIALEAAVGPGREGAPGAVIVHARDRVFLESALRRAAIPGFGRRSLVVLDVDALDPAQQSAFKAAIEAVARQGARACRIIATTSVPLYTRVIEGRFDAGLFHRLNAVHLEGGSLLTEHGSLARSTPEPVAFTPLERGADQSDEGANK